MNKYKVTGENMYGSCGKVDFFVLAESEKQARKNNSHLANINIELVDENIEHKSEQSNVSIPDAEELLYEMDANNCDEITIKEGFGNEKIYSRKEINNYLGLSEE